MTIPCADFTDVTLADEDTNSILADNAYRVFQGIVAMQVTQPDGQHYILVKFGTNSGGITWWSNFELIQVEPHTIGLGTNASGILFSWRDNSS